MKLNEAEQILGVKFPELFQKINQSGMTDYLKSDDGDGEGFFADWMSDCLPICFSKLKEAYDDLYESLEQYPKIYPEYKRINPKYKLIPFARSIGGDKYCFLYEEGTTEPKIVFYAHDSGEIELWAKDFEEFIFQQIVTEVADGLDEEHTLDSDYIKAHIQWLNDTHKDLLSKTSIDEIYADLPLPEEFIIWI